MESQTRTHMCFPKLAPFTSELQGQEANSVSERTWSEKASGMVLAQSYLPVPLLKNTNWLLNKGENLGKPSTCSPTTSSCFQKWVSGPHVENIYNKSKQPVCAFKHTIYLFKNTTPNLSLSLSLNGLLYSIKKVIQMYYHKFWLILLLDLSL